MSDNAEALVERYLKRACILLDKNTRPEIKSYALPTQLQTIMVAMMLQKADKHTQAPFDPDAEPVPAWARK